jgi:hypothetical protein
MGRNYLKIKEFLVLSFLVILAVLPIAYGFHYIDKYGVNIPLDDQWDSIVPWTIQYYQGTFDPTTLITNQQGDSRGFIPGLTIVGISVATGMDIKTIFYAGYIIYICFILLVAWLLFKEMNIQKNYFLLLLLPVFYYAFNPFYLFRFIYNLGSMGALLLLLVLLTIAVLDFSKNQESKKRTYLLLAIAIVLGVMCSFSGAPGLTIWFVGLIQLSLQQTNEKIKKIIIWIIGAGVLFYTYYIALGWNTTGIHGTEGYFSFLITALTYPLNKFLCYLGVLGAEVIWDPRVALVFGAILIGIFILLVYNNRDLLNLDKYSKWYALLAFGSLTGLELALTRSGAVTFLFVPAIRHTYVYFLPLICIYILVLIYTKDSIDDNTHRNPNISTDINTIISKRGGNYIILGMVFCLLLCGTILHIVPGISAAGQSYDKNIKSEYYLLNYGSTSDDILHQMLYSASISGDITSIRTYAPQLEKLHLNIFSNRTTSSSILRLTMIEPDKKIDSTGNILNPEYFKLSSNIQIGKSAMPAIFEHPQGNGSILVYNNHFISNNSQLEFNIGMDERIWNKSTSDGVTFEIRIAQNATPVETTIFSKSINPAKNPGDRSWQYQSIDLKNFSGQLVDIKLITRPNNNSDYDWAWWGDPKIISSE